MITLEIPHTGTTLYLPEDLSECDPRQYADVCELIYRFNSGQIIYNTFKIQAVYKLLNLIPGKTELNEEEDLHKNANISQLADFIDGFFEPHPDNPQKTVIKQNYIHNHIPKIKPLWRTYYGPSDQFRNVSFGEYTDAVNLFSEYEKTKDDECLYLLMAIFYRKKRKFHRLRNLFKYKADVREAYNEDTIEARAKIFKNQPIGLVYGFYLFMASFHKYLTNCVLQLNGKEINIGLLFQESSEKVTTSNMPGLGLKSIEYQISETNVFGTNKEVRETNLWEILIRLYDITKRDADEKARQKEAERKAKSKNQ